MTYTSKSFRKNNYFTLYDNNENLICYFENYQELTKYTKLRIQDIVKFFKNSNDYIKITIQKKEYKLYTFCD